LRTVGWLPGRDIAWHHGAVPTLFALFLVFWVASLVLWIWALVDAIRVPEDRFYRAGTKLVWVLVIVLAGGIGAIIYLVVGRPDPATRAMLRLHGPPPAVVPPPPGGSILPPTP